MTAATVARTTIPPIDAAQALTLYRQRLTAMTDVQLAEERHRLEGQLPYGQAHHLADAEFEGRQAEARACIRCKTARSAGSCCSSHDKQLCHLCYRRTHWVELCAAGCSQCSAEGLPVSLRDLQAVAR